MKQLVSLQMKSMRRMIGRNGRASNVERLLLMRKLERKPKLRTGKISLRKCKPWDKASILEEPSLKWKYTS